MEPVSFLLTLQVHVFFWMVLLHHLHIRVIFINASYAGYWSTGYMKMIDEQ